MEMSTEVLKQVQQLQTQYNLSSGDAIELLALLNDNTTRRLSPREQARKAELTQKIATANAMTRTTLTDTLDTMSNEEAKTLIIDAVKNRYLYAADAPTRGLDPSDIGPKINQAILFIIDIFNGETPDPALVQEYLTLIKGVVSRASIVAALSPREAGPIVSIPGMGISTDASNAGGIVEVAKSRKLRQALDIFSKLSEHLTT